MAPKPSRNLSEVTGRGPDSADGLGHLMFWADSAGKWIPAQHVRYSERSEAWSLVFPGKPMPPVWSAAQSLLVLAESVNDQSVLDLLDEQDPTPAPTPAPEPVGSFDALIDARIDAAVRSGKAGVDDEQVREIVKDFADNLAPKVTRFEYKDREPVEMPEGTHHKALPDVLDVISAGFYPWVVGPAGTGKSTLAKQAAEIMGQNLYELPCSMDMNRSAVQGFIDANGTVHSTAVRDAVMGEDGLLVDEADSCHPGVFTVMNNMLASKRATFCDGTYDKPEGFWAMVAANTWGRGGDQQYVGRNPIDAATLDRFVMVEVDYDRDMERAIATAINPTIGTDWVNVLHKVRDNATEHGIRCVVSTRAVERVNLAEQWGFKRALDATVFRGIADQQKKKMLEGVSL